jgi:hypothetical protein
MTFKIFGWVLVNSIVIFGLYSLCKSHKYVEYRNKWSMSVNERFEYKKKRFCSVPLWMLFLFAIALTFAVIRNAYTTYAFLLVIGLYALFITF